MRKRKIRLDDDDRRPMVMNGIPLKVVSPVMRNCIQDFVIEEYELDTLMSLFCMMTIFDAVRVM